MLARINYGGYSMKKPSQSILLLVAIVLAAFLLSGCGGGSKITSSPVQTIPDNPPVPAQGRLVYSISNAGLFFMNPDGTHDTQIAACGPNYDGHFSRDGKTIVYIQKKDWGVPGSEVWKYYPLTGAKQQFTYDSQQRYAADPTLNSDGTQLIYGIYRGSNFGYTDIYIIGPNDPHGPGFPAISNANHPSMSPDNHTIIFSSDYNTQYDGLGGSWLDHDYLYHIYSYNLSTRVRTQLTDGYADKEPTFSPDGSKIAFARSSNLCVMNSDGSDLRQLTTSDYNSNATAIDGFSPTFSPDGTMIAYVAYRKAAVCGTPTDRAKIYIIRLSDGYTWCVNPKSVTEEYEPSWGPLPTN
jgi:Tol biopolymer transport system component